MSVLISRLPQTDLQPDDYCVVVQGTPAVLRRAKVSTIQAAVGESSGPVGTAPVLRGATHIADLQIANSVYENDLMFCDQGTPPITRLATVAQVLTASGSGGANTEYSPAPNSSTLVSGLPRASSVSLDDMFVVNQGVPPVTKRGTWPAVAVAVEKNPGWMTDILDAMSAPLHANSGIGAYQDYIDPPGVTITHETYAGIEDYAGETIVWVPTWTPTVADPSPTVTPLAGGKVEVYWDTIGGGWPVTSEGVLTLECTVNGTPALTAIEISFGGAGYGQFAWGPTP